MAQPGWYPDPSGQEQLRYWDGQAWSTQTRPAGRRSRAWLLVLLVALVLALLGWFVVREPGSRLGLGRVGGTDETSTPSVSGWDELSTPSASASWSASPQPSGGELVSCPYNADSREEAPRDGRVGAGTISGPVPRGFAAARPFEGRFADVTSTAHKPFPGSSWLSFSQALVLPRELFADVRWAPRQVISCHTTGQFGDDRNDQRITVDEAVTVDGQQGWRVQLTVPSQRTPGGGARYDATAVQLPDGTIAVYWTGVVLADTDALAATDEARKDIRLG